jgi:hypothetical protein
MALGEVVKERLIGILAVIIILTAVGILWPLIQSSLAGTTGLVMLNLSLLGLIVSTGVLLFVIDYFF